MTKTDCLVSKTVPRGDKGEVMRTGPSKRPRLGLPLGLIAHQGTYVSLIQRRLRSCWVCSPGNVDILTREGSNKSTENVDDFPTGNQINQSACRRHISRQHRVEIWNVRTLAHLQPSAIYACPSAPSQHRYASMPTHSCGQQC